MSDENRRSQIQKVKIPEFESQVPQHLLGKLTEQERWLVDTLSRMGQEQQWIIQQIEAQNLIAIDHDERVLKIEGWKGYFTGKMAVVSAVVLIFLSGTVGAFLKPLIERLLSTKP